MDGIKITIGHLTEQDRSWSIHEADLTMAGLQKSYPKFELGEVRIYAYEDEGRKDVYYLCDKNWKFQKRLRTIGDLISVLKPFSL